MKENPEAENPVTVLAVDDEEENLIVCTALLGAWGHKTMTAVSGAECLRAAREGSPDIILLDAKMPGMDGIQTTSKLMSDEATRNIPVVIMTARSDPEDRLAALRAGASDFLSKPIDPGTLKAKVLSLARLKAYNEQMRQMQEGLAAEVAGKRGELDAALGSFGRFVPQEFLKCLGKKSIADVSLGDHVQSEMAILFSDIRDFTALSEKMSPQENFDFLNSYLKRMNPFIWENNGFIDKYVGDQIMALFPGGSGEAVSAAVGMLAYLPVYNAQRVSVGYDPIRIGIGIHAGPVMLGVIGHERFMQGTVIADAVNLASRLETLTKVFGVSLIVSSNVLFNLKDPNAYNYRFLDKLTVRGKEEAVSVYEVFDGDAPDQTAHKKRTREVFERAVYSYHAGETREAFNLFESVRAPGRADKPVELYRRRCKLALKLGLDEEELDLELSIEENL
jgi:two-component system, sensor histidine kinase ChiS